MIGVEATDVAVEDGWAHVAGLTCGQDLSERELQTSGPPPQQYNLGKSFTGFAPIGPCLVTPEELDDPDDIALECSLSGELVQKSSTARMIFTVPQIVAHLSSILTLWPGDLIYTGTPRGHRLDPRPPPDDHRPGRARHHDGRHRHHAAPLHQPLRSSPPLDVTTWTATENRSWPNPCCRAWRTACCNERPPPWRGSPHPDTRRRPSASLAWHESKEQS